MGDASPNIKKLLEIPESDTSALKPIEGYQEVLKEEKTGNDEKIAPPIQVFDSEFKNDAKDYLNAPSADRKDSYFPNEEAVPVMEKNTANLANIVAVAQATSKPRPRAKPRVRFKPKAKLVPKTKKKKPLTVTKKKLTTFKILPKTK